MSQLSKLKFYIYDEDESEIDALKTDLAGEANTIVLSSMDYDIQVNKEDFESSSQRISAEGEQMMVEIMLTPVEEIIKERSISLENTFFEFDSAKIRPEAALELDNVAKVMKKHEDIRIKITSHTDRRGCMHLTTKLYQKNVRKAQLNTLSQKELMLHV